MILLLVSSIFLTFVGLAIVLNVLKHKNRSDSLKIAFFHPFWYFFCHIVMTEEEAKKSFGASSMLYSMKKTTKMFLKLPFIVWFKTKIKFFKKSKYRFHLFRTDLLWTWQDFMIRFKSFMFLARISWFPKRNLPWSFTWFCLSFMPSSACLSTNQMFFMTQQVLHQHCFSQKFCFQPQKPRLMSITLSLVSIWFRKSKKEEATSIMTQGKFMENLVSAIRLSKQSSNFFITKRSFSFTSLTDSLLILLKQTPRGHTIICAKFGLVLIQSIFVFTKKQTRKTVPSMLCARSD
jgi:hypothetical protein